MTDQIGVSLYVERNSGMFSHPNPEAYASDASHIRVFVGERDASCLTLYSFSSVYSFYVLKRVINVGISTFLLTLLHLSLSLAGQVPSKILLNRWNHWDSAHFSSLNESEKMYTSVSVATVPQIGTEVL